MSLRVNRLEVIRSQEKRMKKLLIIALTLGLAGCNVASDVITGSISNPITPKIALQLHTGFAGGVVVVAANYAALPRCSRNPQPCSEQAIVNTLRIYINNAERLLDNLDAWAKGNSNIDAPALYRAAVIAINTAKDYAAIKGIK